MECASRVTQDMRIAYCHATCGIRLAPYETRDAHRTRITSCALRPVLSFELADHARPEELRHVLPLQRREAADAPHQVHQVRLGGDDAQRHVRLERRAVG